ncbi:MAG: 16S rRNA (cytosine(1402)-N(4))-methyltransferase RsmH [Clostridia bacterium]|jgi:16S rRNA (cytosine1402-N4)-methyltransferase|nr:16S rRNA (cytosine(1402)-N(4))-methyltransferase RsmH [Clostridia bacterium]
MMTDTYHCPIMVKEVVNGLELKDGGIYFDGTAGGGGHSFAILKSNPTVRLIATDKDGDAIEAAEERLSVFKGRYRLHRTDFKNFEEVFAEEGVGKIDGYLLDLGISSHQIDDETRGFAYKNGNAPLDMRMDRRTAFSARDVVNGYSEEDLKRILREYGEEQYAPSIARNIVRARENQQIHTCAELEEIVERSVPAKYRYSACARKTFQAIRIEVNGELNGLRECVTTLTRRLKKGGRACILTFHSLEDRIVKQVFRDLSTACTCPKEFPVCVCGRTQEIELIGRKPLTADAEEQKNNSRSKSAKLRIAEKIIE